MIKLKRLFMNDDQNEIEWKKEENWGIFYFSKKDQRWIVPKRHHIGWTFNLGQTKGALIFLSCLIIPFLIVIASLLISFYFFGYGMSHYCR